MGKRQLAEQGGPESDLSSPSPSTTVVVPTYNEEEGIGTVLNKLFACTDGTYEVLVVDADSSDDTRAIASRFPCRIVVEPRRGKGIALKRGIEEASGENVIFIDADDTYPVEAIPAIASKLDNCDVVWTARIKGRENIPKFNRLGNAILSLMHTTLYGFAGHEATVYRLRDRAGNRCPRRRNEVTHRGDAHRLSATQGCCQAQRSEAWRASLPSHTEVAAQISP